MAGGTKKVLTLGAATFEVIEIIRNGNREVLRVRGEDGKIRIAKILGGQKPLAIEDALKQAQYIKLYRRALLTCGVPLPERTELSLGINSKGVELKEFSPDVGTEVSHMLGDSKFGPLVVDQILEKVMKPLFASSKGAVLDVGLDPLTRNFTFNGSITYVDLFPAKITIKGRKTLEFPEPTEAEPQRLGLFRHYRKEGIILVFFMDLCRYTPSLRDNWRSRIYNFLRDIGESRIIKFLNRSPANKLRQDFSRATRVIRAQSGRGISYFFLRDLACEIAFREGKAANPKLEEFFHLTHFQDKPLSVKQIRRAKKFLIEWAQAL